MAGKYHSIPAPSRRGNDHGSYNQTTRTPIPQKSFLRRIADADPEVLAEHQKSQAKLRAKTNVNRPGSGHGRSTSFSYNCRKGYHSACAARNCQCDCGHKV